MKKILLLITLLCGTFITVSAEENSYYKSKKTVQFGFDFGIGYADQWGNAYDPYGKSGLLGFTFGVDLDVNFGKYSFVEVGMAFTRKGCKFEGNEWIKDGGPWQIYDNESCKANLFYLEWPVMYGLSIPLEGDIAWKLMVGPYFACGVAGDRKFNYVEQGERLSLISTFSEDNDYGYRRFDVGGKIQTGVEVNKLSFMVAYQMGFFDTLFSNQYHEMKARNNSIMAIVSFRY
ncbi:MAG: outer membrane beta-barrel protein [Paludibacteraceae bacterium]|nr:outer membrane beta-barrel protein [Paludibacteraceae bacterium]